MGGSDAGGSEEFTFEMEEVCLFRWTYTLRASSMAEALDLAQMHLLSPVARFSRRTMKPDKITSRINGVIPEISPELECFND